MTVAPAKPHPVPWWLLPRELAGTAIDQPRRRRTLRDWAVDATLFVTALGTSAVESASIPYYADELPGWAQAADPYVAFVACVALWWRRRFPVVVAGVVLTAFLIGWAATAPALVAVLTVAVHRGWQYAIGAAAAFVVPSALFTADHPPPGMSPRAAVVMIVLLFLLPLAFGMAVRARRQVVAGLRREAERAVREQQHRLDDARRAERERIAREMHDTLAHRISLISVHAGALAYRTAQAEAGTARPLDPADVGAAIEVINGNARRALVELGDVLAVLRTDGDDAAGAEPPQPSIADIARLIADAEAVGQRVRYAHDCAGCEGLRPAVQRSVYRTVQEGLTNARKHAPGLRVEVSVRGEPGRAVIVSVTNPLPLHPSPSAVPGAGVGLAGLAERVALDGGTLEHGPSGSSFRLVARLPWPP